MKLRTLLAPAPEKRIGLKMARSRFRKEIHAADAPDADFFLKMLEIRKQNVAGKIFAVKMNLF